jgi:hypothetical protein
MYSIRDTQLKKKGGGGATPHGGNGKMMAVAQLLSA